MSTFVTSKGTRGQHVSPRFESQRYVPSPARREAIGGRVRPMVDEPQPLWWRLVFVAVMLGCAVYALKIAVIG